MTLLDVMICCVEAKEKAFFFVDMEKDGRSLVYSLYRSSSCTVDVSVDLLVVGGLVVGCGVAVVRVRRRNSGAVEV